ncbi:PolC-type DNA polymerase III [Alkalinema pantanalense CENA528]|uniref:3'-5' exonuclease n=1 Tax=Alkalinema pantanalense TaxID=1620705 RepID=UPI003D6F5BD9
MLSTDLLAFYRDIAQQDLTIVDLETTGYKPPQARVTEIAVIHANLTTGITFQQTSLINSQTQIPEFIVQLTGIQQAMVDNAPLAIEVWPQYWPWVQSGILTCHNLEFDYAFLKAELRCCQIDFSKARKERFCTLQLARLMLPDLPSRSLPDLVQYFGFTVERSHRAAADALACWLLAQQLLTEILNTEDEVLLQRFGQQWLPLPEVARLLQCKPQAAAQRLQQAGIESRESSRRRTFLYPRSAVESLIHEIAN